MVGTANFCPDPNLYPDPTGRADRVCRFVRRLKLWEGRYAGEPFRLAPYQHAILNRVYGPTSDDGRRLVRTACIWLPRGHGKTTLCSALSLAHLLGPESEAGGQIVQAAADRENAAIAFNSAFQMVRQDHALLSRTRPQESRKKLIAPKSNSTMTAISTEAYSKHGLNVSFFLADEAHSWPAAEARKLFGVIRDSMVKRESALTIVISTAGEGRNSLAWDLWQYSQGVAKGEIDDPTFAPILFSAPPDADWQDEAVWRDACPAIDAGFLNVAELRAKVREAEHMPMLVDDFRQYHLNIWRTTGAARYFDMSVWDSSDHALTDTDFLGRPCIVAVDLSSSTDLTAIVCAFSREDGGVDLTSHFFLPEAGLKQREARDKVPYAAWERARWLTLTPGDVIDHRAVTAFLKALAERYEVREFVFDRAGATSIMSALTEANLPVTTYGQGFLSMGPATRELTRTYGARAIHTDGNECLRWTFSNVVAVKDDAENVKFSKARSTARIDGAVAAAMCFGRIDAIDAAASRYTPTLRPEGLLWI